MLQRAGVKCCYLVLAMVVYVASYGPYLRIKYGGDSPPTSYGMFCSQRPLDSPFMSETTHGFYAPVEWMIDHTSAGEPLFLWAKTCGAWEKARFDACCRYMDSVDGRP